MALLDGLSEIDWSSFHHAYGPASDVPGLLRGLARADQAPEEVITAATRDNKSVASHLRSQLWGNVFHQGTRWGVTAQVVPFLYELLRDGPTDTESRHFLLDYLHHLACGYPTDLFPRQVEIAPLIEDAAKTEAMNPPPSVVRGDVFGEPDVDDDPAIDWSEHASVIWERDCYLAVEQGLADVLPLLADADELLARRAAALVASFPRVTSTTVPALWAQVASGAPGRRGPPLLALAQLGADVREAVHVVLDSSEAIEGLYAAAAEVLSRGEAASIFSWARLADVDPTLSPLVCPFADTVGSLVLLCLEKSSESFQATAIDQLIELLISDHEKSHLAAGLLRMIFKSAPSALSVQPWSPLQGDALMAIIDHGDWRASGETWSSALDATLRRYQLPTKREALRQLVLKQST